MRLTLERARWVLPLLPFLILSMASEQIFPASMLMSMAAFFMVGVMKGHVLNCRRVGFGLETMIAGAAAASASHLLSEPYYAISINWFGCFFTGRAN